MTDDSPLLAALAVIQSRGAIGEKSLTAAVSRAGAFADLIPDDAETVVDLGSGGGLPALVIAWRRPALAITMVERRATRADLLCRAIGALGLGERASVLNTDAELLARRSPNAFDAVTARSFADVGTTVALIDRLLRRGGVGLVSEPPNDRTPLWTTTLTHHPLLIDMGVVQGIRRLGRG